MFTSHVKLMFMLNMNKFDTMTMYRSSLRRNRRLVNLNMLIRMIILNVNIVRLRKSEG